MCDVFKSSPYFHIGGDEIELDWFKAGPHVAKYLKKHNMRDDATRAAWTTSEAARAADERVRQEARQEDDLLGRLPGPAAGSRD